MVYLGKGHFMELEYIYNGIVWAIVWDPNKVVCLLLVYVLPTYKGISGWVPTFTSVHSWQLYSAGQLGDP